MRRAALLAVTLLATACSDPAGTGSSVVSPTTSVPMVTTSSPDTTATLGRSTTTVHLPSADARWTEAGAERDVENYLAALAAGEFQVAGWSAANRGIVFEGQENGETTADFLERMCAGGACQGPYEVVADDKAREGDDGQLSSTVTVTHLETGQSGSIELATFEGKKYIADLPPLVPSGESTPLVESLFGRDVPDRVVVGRFRAFEVWESGSPAWSTNWWSGEPSQVEGDFTLSRQTRERLIANLLSPDVSVGVGCPASLMTRDDAVLRFDRCDWTLFDISTGDQLDPAFEYQEPGETESLVYLERGGTALRGVADAEGNMVELVTDRGVDVLGDDYAGYIRLSTDGRLLAYTDHRDPRTFDHFWSPVVVVKDTTSGVEVGRWVLDTAVSCLEFSETWVVACAWVIDPGVDPEHEALVAIDIRSGETHRVETRAKVFLPS